ncbi:MAG TPA: hypothetical protein VIC60_09700, partial [Thermomicrobiales bacterium]
RIVAPLGTHLFPFKQKMRHVTWFLMEATGETDNWQAHLGADTFLLAPADAAAKLSHDESRTLLERAVAARGLRTKD